MNPYLKIVAFTVVICIATLIFNNFGFRLPIISWFTVVYFLILGLLIHAITFPPLKNNSKAFTGIFMGTQGVRMFFSLGFLILYLLFTKEISVPYIIYFLLLYLLFAAFEIYLLLYNLRTDFTKGSISQ